MGVLLLTTFCWEHACAFTLSVFLPGAHAYAAGHTTSCQLRARRALSIFKDVPLTNRRALSLYTRYSNSALLVLNGTSLNSDSALLALNRRYDSSSP